MLTLTPQPLGVFVATLGMAILSPGPGVIAVSQCAFALGRRRALPYACGLALGASLWCAFSLLGLAVLFQVMPATYRLLRLAGGAYLLWIAWKMWRAATDPLPHPAESRLGMSFLGGIALNLSNPKPALFYSAVLLSIFPTALSFADKLLIYATALTVEMGFYVTLVTLMALPALRQRYYGSKFWIDRGAAGLIALLGMMLILKS